MVSNPQHATLRAGPTLRASPLDPPPFFLEKEIRLPTRLMGVYAVVTGVLVLVVLRFIIPVHANSLPSLTRLFVSAIGTTGFYCGFRFLTYWAVWAYVIRKYPSSGGIHPAARGELPRNCFLLVFFAPGVVFIPLCAILARLELGFSPTLWLAVAVVAGISLRDVHAGWTILSCDTSAWVKETSTGLDILRPVTLR
jgi:hypothetical protein